MIFLIHIHKSPVTGHQAIKQNSKISLTRSQIDNELIAYNSC